jgi:hypothetical protein
MTGPKIVPIPVPECLNVQETLQKAMDANLPHVLILSAKPNGNIQFFEDGNLNIAQANYLIDGYKLDILLRARK